ncbi:MAG: CDP-glycerol glycerophosphotransferase family protein, partial [Planctomycetaceae bacterium]|nr:CDP-glycerol glycerophosphotransferase family protein [Planctomycetaceae bacterium]
MAGIFREIRDFFRYLMMPIESKRVLFYSEHAGYTINFRPIIDQLIQKYDLKICYVTSDPSDPILKAKDKNVTVFYSRTLLTFLMGILADKTVCVMTVTELNNTPILKRSVNDVHYVYVFHALMSTHMIYKFGAFDHYDTIITAGSYQDKEIQKAEELYQLKKKRIVSGGYTRLDDIAKEYQKYVAEHSELKGNKRLQILVAPSWSKTSFVENYRDSAVKMIESLVETGFDITLRYHPETVRRRQDIIDFFDMKFCNNEHIFIEKSVADNKSLLRSDLLITDWSGISLEYSFGTERPVLFLETTPKIHNERYKELEIEPFEVNVRNEIGQSVTLDKIDNISRIVYDMVNLSETYREKIIRFRTQNIFHFNNAAEKTADIIYDTLK